ncbi:MAG: Gmad2 immunoglobulin-like domain-containing protein [Minisyncoccia bacterium]
MKKILIIVATIIIAINFIASWRLTGKEKLVVVTNFAECYATGSPIMESYPRQCRYDGKIFTENIGNELGKADLIHLDSPRPNQIIQSPLIITGQARGNWFFEASFPVSLVNWDGLIITQGIAQAKSDWMTTDFVPFEATLSFTVDKDVYSPIGALILRKDNPSGLPEHDDALEIPIVFQK